MQYKKNTFKKNIIVLADTTSIYSIKMLYELINQKFFNIKHIFFSNSSSKKNITNIINDFSYKVTYTKVRKLKSYKLIINLVKDNDINLCISTSFPYKIDQSFLSLFKIGVINFHPSALPKNRGSHHSFWGIYNNTNHGCTMHLMTNELDKGPIIDQCIYKNNLSITAEEVFKKSHNLMIFLLKRNLKKLYFNNFKVKKNTRLKSSFHNKGMINKKINLNISGLIKVSDLWKIIRGTRIDEHGFYINIKNKKYKIISEIKKIK
tara:strand:- start:664 stop:1452 length:789 start_codon:yes stop_codon:yes gene_type:complete